MSQKKDSKLKDWLREKEIVIKFKDFLKGLSPWGLRA